MPEGAIYVGRPSLWGNPWTLREAPHWVPGPERAAWAVAAYRRELMAFGLVSDYAYAVSDDRWEATDRAIRATEAGSMAEYAPFVLRGHDLACWCPLDQPCHADVLLELANSDTQVSPKP